MWTPNDETAVEHDTTVEPDTMTEMESTTEPKFNQVFTPTVSKTLRHYFLSKTVRTVSWIPVSC